MSLLERFFEDASDVFDTHVLPRLDSGDLAVLATVNRKMRDVVFEFVVKKFGRVIKTCGADRRAAVRCCCIRTRVAPARARNERFSQETRCVIRPEKGASWSSS